MARKYGPTISQEELYPLADEPGREESQDARLLDLDVEQESPFLRVQKRVSVRRGSLPKKTATRLTWAAVALGVVFACGMTVAALYHYGERSWRFRVESSDDIEISGLQNVTRSQVMEVMGGDIGRNIFFVPLAQRKAAAGTDSVGRIRQRDALCSQSPEGGDSRAHPGSFRAGWLEDSADRRRRHADGTAGQEEIFLSRNPGDEQRRAAFHARRPHENLQRRSQPARFRRRALFAGAQRSRPLRSG